VTVNVRAAHKCFMPSIFHLFVTFFTISDLQQKMKKKQETPPNVKQHTIICNKLCHPISDAYTAEQVLLLLTGLNLNLRFKSKLNLD